MGIPFEQRNFQKELDKKREEAWENIKEGEIVKGIVARIVDYGAFIDLGGIDGLVHITDLTWGRIRNPKEVLKQGEEIEVKVSLLIVLAIRLI